MLPFTVSSFQQKRGFLTSPQHSLPSKTTCTYLLEGSPGEIVWISLLKFYIGKEYGKSGDEGGGGSGGYNVAGLTGSYNLGASSSSLSSSSGGSGLSAPSNYMTAMSQVSTMSSLECNTTYFQIWQGTYSKFPSFSSIFPYFSLRRSHPLYFLKWRNKFYFSSENNIKLWRFPKPTL